MDLKEKLIIINWRFKNKEQNSELVSVEDNQNAFLVYTNFNEGKIDEFKNFILENLNSYKQILILTHTSDPNLITKEKLKLNYNEQNVRVNEFSSNLPGKIYADSGLIDTGSENFDDTIKFYSITDNNAIVKANYFQVWNYYWSESILQLQKKKLIDTFLPLAIDMLGLSEITDKKEVKEKYYYEVELDIHENWDSIIKAWNEIKFILGLRVDSNNEPIDFLSEEYQLTPKEKELTYFPLENEGTPGISKDKLINLFNSLTKENGNELFLWLNRVVDLINEKLIPADVNE